MVLFTFFAKSRLTACALAATSLLFGANPAFANSAASADIAAPLRAAQASKPQVLGKGDDQFRKLFNNWKALDNNEAAALLAFNRPNAAQNFISGAVPAVSIPSLRPLDASVMTSGFGMREHPILGGRRAHKGVDLAAPVGTPVHATADGTVEMAQWFGGYGLYVALEHGGDIETRYGHMSQLNVAAGQHVHKGDVIGYVGTTGRSTGPHLHYEVRVNGVAVNPIPYMQGDAHLASAADLGAKAHAIGGPDEDGPDE